MNNEIYAAAGAFALGFFIYWLFSKKLKSAEEDLAYTTKVNEILKEDKYKTKGRFE